jgi:Conserved TM helix
MPVQFQTWGDAMMASVSQALAIFLAAIPKLIGFVIILVAGWALASLLARGVEALLRTVRFNQLAERSGFSAFVTSTGVETDASGFLALIAKWFVRLLALVVAFDALGLPAVSDVLRQMLLWLPNLVVGLVVLVIGGLAANALAAMVRGSTARAGLDNPDMLANIARIAVWGFAIVIAVNQIGIAQTLINTLFMAIVGSVALALGLAFGLGGRETAAEILQDWRAKGRAAAPKLEKAAVELGKDAGLKPRSNGDDPNLRR